MVRFIAAASVLVASSLNAATISTTGPAPGLTHVIVDQPYGQFSKVGLSGSSLQSWGFDEFWTDASQVWITDSAGLGSLHTLVLAPEVSLIAIRPTYVPDVAEQEFAYEYQIGSLRQQLGPINLPYGAAAADAIPEPASATLAALCIVALAGIVSRRRGLKVKFSKNGPNDRP